MSNNISRINSANLTDEEYSNAILAHNSFIRCVICKAAIIITAAAICGLGAFIGLVVNCEVASIACGVAFTVLSIAMLISTLKSAKLVSAIELGNGEASEESTEETEEEEEDDDEAEDEEESEDDEEESEEEDDSDEDDEDEDDEDDEEDDDDDEEELEEEDEEEESEEDKKRKKSEESDDKEDEEDEEEEEL